jgi:hypothetical protein
MIPVSLGDWDHWKTISTSEDSGPECGFAVCKNEDFVRMRTTSWLWNKRKAGMVKGAIRIIQNVPWCEKIPGQTLDRAGCLMKSRG